MLTGSNAATLCGNGTYRADVLDASSVIRTCQDCPLNSGTDPTAALGATSSDACLALPGYKFVSGTTFSQCGTGAFNVGYNKETACDSCGTGLLTATATASSAGDCYTLEGYGATFVTATNLTATICPANTYGRPNKTLGRP